MASDVNHVILTGRLTADAVAKEAAGKKVFSGSIAVGRYSKKENKEIPSFFNFSVWSSSDGQTGYFEKTLKKGTLVVLDGSLDQQTWEKDGQKQSRVIVQAEKIVPMVVGNKSEGGSNVPSYDTGSGFQENIPF